MSNIKVPKENFRRSQIGSGARAMLMMKLGKLAPEIQVMFQPRTGAEYNLVS